MSILTLSHSPRETVNGFRYIFAVISQIGWAIYDDECSTEPLINHLSENLEIFLLRSSKFAQSAADLKYVLQATLTLGFGQVQSSCADGHRRQKAEGNRPF